MRAHFRPAVHPVADPANMLTATESAEGGYRSDLSVWRFGLPTANLGGTARTLDEADGEVDGEALAAAPGPVPEPGAASMTPMEQEVRP